MTLHQWITVPFLLKKIACLGERGTGKLPTKIHGNLTGGERPIFADFLPKLRWSDSKGPSNDLLELIRWRSTSPANLPGASSLPLPNNRRLYRCSSVRSFGPNRMRPPSSSRILFLILLQDIRQQHRAGECSEGLPFSSGLRCAFPGPVAGCRDQSRFEPLYPICFSAS